ncbi:MAG: hypothetical protein IKX36_11450 [Prevotella sp.]|nr:hypothetical protein [Prevotella sp.]
MSKNNNYGVLTAMLITMLLLVSCGGRSVVDTVNEMYDVGVERVQKAENMDDIQKIYDEVTQQVKDFKTEHLKEFAALDSTTNLLSKAENMFVKACCIRLSDMGSNLQTVEGLICIDDNGDIVYLEESEDLYGSGESESDLNNPLNFVSMKVIFDNRKDAFLRKNKIKLQTVEGDYKYSDEDAELYYNLYAARFVMAKIICDQSKNAEVRKYIENNLFDIVNHLPLNDSYPENVKEEVNKLYYDNKDYIENTLHIAYRQYGVVCYEYTSPPVIFVGQVQVSVRVKREDDGLLYIK